MMMEKSCSSNSEAMDSYVKALEEEKKKILVFERELPLSLQLVTQAIGNCRRQHVDREEILTNGPVLEEFMPLRPSNSSSSTEEEEERRRNCDDNKPDWLRSVQLWKELDQPRGDVLRKPIAVSVKRVGAGGAFHPFESENNVKGPVVVAAPATSMTETNGGEEKENEGQCSQRKARRCWSSELHHRFLNALNQLGGSRAATPKQIRDLMKVDALTNDEVKSHLQKYRLHTRRPNSGTSSSSNSTQIPQIILVGGLWMPPPEYSAAAAAPAAAAQPMSETAGVPLNRVYAPVAALPSELGSEHLQKNKQQSKKSPTEPLNSGGRCSGDDSSEDGERTNSNSSVTASSSQTTTGSRSLSSLR